jgi:DNA polymerase III subunit beta
MKLVHLNRDDLLRPLQTVSGIVEKRHTLPILSNVLLERTADRMSLLATDLEIQVTTSFACESTGAEPTFLTLSARKLQEILRALPDKAEVSLEVENSRAQVRSGKSRFKLQTLPADDFPRLAAASGNVSRLTISQQALRGLLLLVQYAMAQQDIRYYLNGMLLVVEGTNLRAVATDGHRLALASVECEASADRIEVILPRKAVLELVKLLADSEEKAVMEFSAAQAKFSFGEVTLVTKVVDGKFPDYARVVPINYDRAFEIDRLELQEALQRVSILSNEKFRGVRWMLTNDNLRIACTNTEQEEAYEELEIHYRGEPLDIGFNITYLLDLLSNVTSTKVTCAFGDANSSVLLTITEKPDFRYVVMPMRI